MIRSTIRVIVSIFVPQRIAIIASTVKLVSSTIARIVTSVLQFLKLTRQLFELSVLRAFGFSLLLLMAASGPFSEG